MIMEISVISFTEAGKNLSKEIRKIMNDQTVELYSKRFFSETEEIREVSCGLEQWTRQQFQFKRAIIFIGAAGIAVRAIAPCLENKLTDSPVIVLDEKGKFVIPILSGHVGGANELALFLAERLGAVPVITTATDVNSKIAIDVWAKDNFLNIENKEGIARVSSKVLSSETVTLKSEIDIQGKTPAGFEILGEGPLNYADVVISSDRPGAETYALHLRPKAYVLGIGCRRDKEFEMIEEFIERKLKENGLNVKDICAVASIDKKKDEKGIMTWAQKQGVPFICFTEAQLNGISGEFSSSDFVKSKVGVDNVCERAALAACDLLYQQVRQYEIIKKETILNGINGELVLKKQAENGMTLAIAKRKVKLFWKE